MSGTRPQGWQSLKEGTCPFILMMALPVVLALVSTSCNEPFDPRGELDRQLVVYAVLSTDRSAQFVRVQSNYMPQGFDPSAYTDETWVSDASVILSDGGKTWLLCDTALVRTDTTRYKNALRLYMLDPFVPERGKTYGLLVQSPSIGIASANTVVPGKAAISLFAAAIALEEPFKARRDEIVEYAINLGNGTGGYSSHLYIYYDVLKGSRWVEERFEVPLEPVVLDTSYSIDQPIYDEVHALPQVKNTTVKFRVGYLQTIVKQLSKATYINTHIIYKWVVLTVLQMDQNLYRYYKIVRGFQDPLSIRLDQPLYSKIDGGVGVVGAYSLDSLTTVLPELFGGNH